MEERGKMNIDYICKDCNSTENVFFDAYATWDPKIQEVVHECTLDHCECSCGSTNIEEIEYISVEKKSILDKVDNLINLLRGIRNVDM
jgi:hypothetical protein